MTRPSTPRQSPSRTTFLPALLPAVLLAGALGTVVSPVAAQSFDVPRKIDGYRGIWFDLGQRLEYGSKYSGGLGTYTAKHHPIAIHAPQVEKTFFVYGGTVEPHAAPFAGDDLLL